MSGRYVAHFGLYDPPPPVMAWGFDSSGALCIRCACGKIMRLENPLVNDDGSLVYEYQHLVVNSGGDPIGMACGLRAKVELDRWQEIMLPRTSDYRFHLGEDAAE